jgi:hypothetical protein
MDMNLDDLPDFIGEADLAGRLPEETIRRLAARAVHIGLDGRPCWSRDELVLALMEIGDA